MSDNNTALLLGVKISTLILGGLIIFARVITRAVIKPALGMDDLMIVITWFLILSYEIATFVAIQRGFGQHLAALSPERAASAQEAEVAAQVLAIFSFPTGKAAVACLLVRLFPGSTLRWVLWIFVAANAVFFYLDGIFILVQCTPVDYQWDRTIEGGTCWSPAVIVNWGYLTGVTGAFTDLVLAIIPWFYISKLQMHIRKKIMIGVALSLGLFPCACSVVKIYYTSTLGTHTDSTFDTVPLFLWSSAELCAINVAACIPTLRPLYLWLRGRGAENSSGPARMPAEHIPSAGTHGTRFLRRPGWLSDRRNGATQLVSVDSDSRHIYETGNHNTTTEDRLPSSFPANHATTTINANASTLQS